MKLLLTLFTAILLSLPLFAQDNEHSILLEADSFPYAKTIRYAAQKGDRILIGKALAARGEYYEKHGKKREAIKEYQKAYQQDTKTFAFALQRAEQISQYMENAHNGVLNEIEERNNRRRGAIMGVITATADVAETYAESKRNNNAHNESVVNAPARNNTQGTTSNNSYSSTGSYPSTNNSSSSTSSNTYNSSTSRSTNTNSNSSAPTYRDCRKCGGSGKVACNYCKGHGRYTCPNCNGTGHNWQFKNRDCTTCSKKGSLQCNSCYGKGTKKCISCNGTGKVRN